MYGLEVTLLIESKSPSLKLVVELLPDTSLEEECLLYLERLELVMEAQKKRVKALYDRTVCPLIFSKGDLDLLYDQANDKLGAGKFEPMWHGPYIVDEFCKKVLMSESIMKGILWLSPKISFTLRIIMHDFLCKYFCTLVCFISVQCGFGVLV